MVVIATLLLACSALAQQTYCPDSISVIQSITKTPDGWTASQDKLPTTLSAVTFFSGPPEEQASLVYDKWTKRNGLADAVWHFTPTASPAIWMSCRYSSTQIVLSKRLPARITDCTVTYDPNITVSGNPQIRGIACH
jgi:hypothetical protein